MLSDVIAEVIRFTTTGERLLSALKDARDLGQRLAELSENDPETIPNLEVAGEHLALAAEALGRAMEFANARLEVRMQQITDDL